MEARVVQEGRQQQQQQQQQQSIKVDL